MSNKIDRVNKPIGCIKISYNDNGKSKKYQKHKNKTNNFTW